MGKAETINVPIYLDYLSTTPVDPRVVEAMTQCLSMDGVFGNPASRSHQYGWKAEEAIENARCQVAELINADPREIVWTSGATSLTTLRLKVPRISTSARVSTSLLLRLSTRPCWIRAVSSSVRASMLLTWSQMKMA